MNRKITMNGFTAEPEKLIASEIAAAERVIRSGWYILGHEVKQFEKQWAGRCGVKHAVGVGNGCDAIEIGLRAMHIGAGDEVITTPMSAFATVLAILRAGATPVLADIDPETAILDLASVERCLSPKTKAVLLVHLYGQVPDLPKWAAFCRRAGIHLLEDCAQAHLAEWEGRRAGSFGVWGACSFYPTKNLGALGDAGALVTDSAEIAASAAMMRNYGQSERYHHPVIGMNSRLDEFQAALLSARIEWLEAFTARRGAIAARYLSGIRNPEVRCLRAPQKPGSHVYHLFVVRSPQRERLASHLAARNIETLVHYPIPIHHQEPCRGLRRDPAGLSQCEAHATECLSIPCHPQLTDEDIEHVISSLNAFQ